MCPCVSAHQSKQLRQYRDQNAGYTTKGQRLDSGDRRVFCSSNRSHRLSSPSILLFSRIRGLFPLEKKGRGIPPLKMSGATPPFPPHAFMAWTGTVLPYFVRPSVLSKRSSDFQIGVTQRITMLDCYLLATAAVGQILVNFE